MQQLESEYDDFLREAESANMVPIKVLQKLKLLSNQNIDQ